MHLMSTVAVDRALAFFEQVINKRDGTLKLYARQEQAAILQRTGHENEAVALYDVILSAQPPPDAELRQAALCGKGDNLRALGGKDPKKLEAARAVFEELAALPGVLPVWRNQALYKKAKTLEQLGRNDEAVDTYYDVLEKSATPGEHEYFWYYKAGFDAAHIFEQSAQWKSALGFYEKMAKFGGPRAGEAAAKVRQIRLEHFIWD
jgi:tetratricopeptide (TPR) repeat protein